MSAINKTVVSVLFVLFAFALVGSTVAAEEPSPLPESNLTVFPALIEISGELGHAQEETLIIVNNSDEPIPIVVEVKSLIPADEILDLSKRSEFDASRWIDVNPKYVAIKPGETVKIAIEMQIPENATQGGHYAEIVIGRYTLGASSTIDKTQTVIIPQLKVPVLINAGDDPVEELILEAGDIFPKFLHKINKTNTKIAIANVGNTHTLPNITIKLLKNEEVLQAESYSPGIILPNTKKAITAKWAPKVPIGIYKAQADVRYGTDSKVVSSKQETIIVFYPVWVILLVLLVVITLMYLFMKRKNITAAFKALKNLD